MLNFSDVAVSGKTVVIREDFNVPMSDGVIMSDARIQSAVPTIRLALMKGASVVLLSHLGRPTEGVFDPALSLAPIALRLSQLLRQKVRLISEYLNGLSVQPGEVVLCENVRFNVGEKANQLSLAKQLAALGDVYVMDAFATAHRAEASTEGALHYAKIACAGPLLCAELTALAKALIQPARPLLVLVGGAKISTKLALLEQIADKADQLIVGGGILNTFILASGFPIGKSLAEPELVPVAKRILAKMQQRGAQIPMPVDVCVSKQFSADSPAIIKPIQEIAADEMILDIGPKTAIAWSKLIEQAKTIVWNGPVGVFEFTAFSSGTHTIAQAIAASTAFSIAGGGDTLAAIEKFGVASAISYISTGGGAFLEYLEGKVLPAVSALS